MSDKENLHVNNTTVSEQEISSVKFERFIDFMTRMIEKYGNDIDFSK